MDNLSHHVHPILRKNRNTLLFTLEQMVPPIQHLGKFKINFLNWKLLLKKPLRETDVTLLVPNKRSDNGKKALTVRNLCDHLTDLNIDIPAGNYIFKINNRNTRARCEICSKLQRH